MKRKPVGIVAIVGQVNVEAEMIARALGAGVSRANTVIKAETLRVSLSKSCRRSKHRTDSDEQK
jgi:hypothetical protein